MTTVSPKPSESKPFRLDSRGRVIHRRKTHPKWWTCAACGAKRKSDGLCVPCWDELKIFRRYLRETLRLEPIPGDFPEPEINRRIIIFSWPVVRPGRRGAR